MTMMRRHARSESPKIVRKVKAAPAVASPETAPAPADVGSRVFPLRAAPARMPSPGARRSTRLFVSKASPRSLSGDSKNLDLDTKVLRSGKRLVALEPDGKRFDGEAEWIRVFGESGHCSSNEDAKIRWSESVSEVISEGMPAVSPQADGNSSIVEDVEKLVYRNANSGSVEKMFGIVYDRKRRKSDTSMTFGDSSSSSVVDDGDSKRNGRFGMVFSRKDRGKKLKVTPLMENIKSNDGVCGLERQETELRIAESSWKFAMAAGMLIDRVVSTFAGRIMLIVLVEHSSASSCKCFSRLLVEILSWMRRARLHIKKFTAFLLAGSLANVFARHGVHILPTSMQKHNALFTTGFHSCGVCNIYGTRKSTPLIFVDFLALPSYFETLHIALLVGALQIPRSFARVLNLLCTDLCVEVQLEETNADTLIINDQGNELSLAEFSSFKRKESHVETFRSVAQNTGLTLLKIQKNQRKRSSPRYFKKRNPSPRLFPSLHSKAKRSFIPKLVFEPVQVEVPDASTDDSSCRDESDISTPIGSGNKYKNIAKNTIDQSKEKADLARVRQNIMAERCKANVLVCIDDRCWREEGFEVMLDLLPSGECIIAVKAQNQIRYSHKPQDMKPCAVNRFTHAYMWTAEDGWKLEFLNRWDWLIFKELHLKCRELNRLELCSRVIPIPGVQLVRSYDDYTSASFERANEYIKVKDDEVKRALEGGFCMYDMDSDDEVWLNNLNSNLSQSVSAISSNVSEERFENIVYTFEKDAYRNVDELFDRERALEHYYEIADMDTLSAIYDYWIKKRNKRHAALSRVFQGPPLRKVQLMHKPFLRKKRSFKKQKSQSGRVKQEVILEAEEKDEASLQRVNQAESAANQAAESAIELRSRAQILMANAELAVYKSVMALQIADAIEVSESPELASALLD